MGPGMRPGAILLFCADSAFFQAPWGNLSTDKLSPFDSPQNKQFLLLPHKIKSLEKTLCAVYTK